EFERVSKILPHVRRDRPRSQRLNERSVRAANGAVSEPPSEITPAQPECPRAINDKPRDRIAVLPDTQSKSRTHAASIRFKIPDGPCWLKPGVLVGERRRQADPKTPPWRRQFAAATT